YSSILKTCFHNLSRQKSPYTPIKRLWSRDVGKSGKIINCLSIRLCVYTGQLKKTSDLTSKCKSIRRRRIKKRFDSEAIARQHERSGPRVVNSYSEHAAQPSYEIRSLFLVEIRQHLRVRTPPEHMAPLLETTA